jgi:hypothetical protein
MAKRAWTWLKGWVWTLTDAIPPYHIIEGPLDSKEIHHDGKPHIIVGSASVEVDAATFDTLVVGENLRVRYTKGNRAVNIDRLLPGKGPG